MVAKAEVVEAEDCEPSSQRASRCSHPRSRRGRDSKALACKAMEAGASPVGVSRFQGVSQQSDDRPRKAEAAGANPATLTIYGAWVIG